jgi:hypothetical protein
MDKTDHPLPPGEGHEPDVVTVPAVTKAGLAIGALVIVTAFLMWLLFDHYAARAARLSPRPEPMAELNPQKEPPQPRLQASPVKDLATFRAEEDAILNSYGPVDPEKGIVRIPVERALELVAKEGLPSRKQEGR